MNGATKPGPSTAAGSRSTGVSEPSAIRASPIARITTSAKIGESATLPADDSGMIGLTHSQKYWTN